VCDLCDWVWGIYSKKNKRKDVLSAKQVLDERFLNSLIDANEGSVFFLSAFVSGVWGAEKEEPSGYVSPTWQAHLFSCTYCGRA